jgi:hypothetical protein
VTTVVPSLAARVHDACAAARAVLARGPAAGARSDIEALELRLAGPLRVAVVGRAKAGKSTLLNALVGERVAATDAGECTRIPTWYRHGDGYRVDAVLLDGTRRELRAERGGAQLRIDLGGLAAADVERIDVAWPSAALRELTLIDTPGLAGHDRAAAARTGALLALDAPGPGEADAVLYCLRHLHDEDRDFLEAFADDGVARPSPIGAVAVLTRADELGAGRPDALASAGRVAARWSTDVRVRALCAGVVPVAGLVAETARTLREDEAAAVRALAALDGDARERALASADRVVTVDLDGVDVAAREAIVDRLGLFGVRVGVACVDQGATTASALAAALLERSGIAAVRAALRDDLLARARLLQARAVLAGLRAIAREVASVDPAAADAIAATVERVEAGAVELRALRVAHLILGGATRLPPRDAEDALRLARAAGPAERLGVAPDTPIRALAAAAAGEVARWRARAGAGLLDPVTTEVVDDLVRLAEALHAATATGPA